WVHVYIEWCCGKLVQLQAVHGGEVFNRIGIHSGFGGFIGSGNFCFLCYESHHTHLQMAQKDETIKIIAKERRTLRRENAKKDYTISRLRAKIASLKETIKTQEDQLKDLEGEGEGEDIQGDGYSYMSNDNDYEEEDDEDLAFHPYEDGHEHLEAGMDDTFPINVEEE
ncbi:hypothetical protein QYE76_040966, partial [Lolium multiflorum]